MEIIVEEEAVVKFQNLITDIAVIASIMASNEHEDGSGLITRMMGVNILENATDIVETVFGTDSSVAMLSQVQREVEEAGNTAMQMIEEINPSSEEELIEELLDRLENQDEE